jgi:YbbR domain-containing protein
LIRRLNYSDISPAKIDLRNVQGGVFYFDEAMFDFPSGIKVLSISPAKLNLRYEPRIHKQVPIRANFRGKPKPMLSVQKVSLVPNRARISGPKSVISGISELKSEPIDVAILGPRRYKKRVNIALPHSEIISSSKVVTVSFEIAPKIVTKLFAKLPVKVLNTSMRVKLRPEKVDIVLQGPQQVIETLNPEMITPYLDAREETRKGQGTYRKTYIVSDLPDKVKVIEYRPSFVFITLSY